MSCFKILAIVLPLFIGLGGCSRKPKDHRDQVSYAIGAQFGKSLKSQNLDLTNKFLCRGIEDGYKNEKFSLTDEEMQAAMMKLAEMQQKQIRDDAEKNKIVSDKFLAENKNKEGVKVTSSGLQYTMKEEGTGPSPKSDDVVVVHYKGTLSDGKEFDSSYKRNQPAEFPVRGVIPGWTEGLQMMKKGGKAIFYVPPELGYGDRPRQNIPSSAVLIFDVELLDVKSPPKPAAPPAPAKKK